jgi:ABC-type bacteriocin/lantibiotic exporter with double-glycine peptidase domain
MTVINQDKIVNKGHDFIPENSFKGSIKFNKVDFHYPNNKTKIISELTCEFEANKSTALFGVKCGKSTIM